MDPESMPTRWSHRQAPPAPSNQQNLFFGTRSKQTKDDRAVVGRDPELESSSVSSDGSDFECDEFEHEVQGGVDSESRESLLRRCNQLQEDVEVLASHLESQEQAHKQERDSTEKERRTLVLENESMKRELSGLRIEKDALRKQNAQLATQQAEGERQADASREAHEDMVLALTQQQKECELLQSSVMCAARERTEARKALDRAQMHCRRLEEELSSAHAQVLHLQNERNTLQAALNATATGVAGYEAKQLKVQDEIIAGLRADLLQMEFEMKTLSIDKASLADQVDKLHLRLESSDRSADYEVVPLNNSTRDAMAKSKQQKKRTTIRPIKPTKDETSRRGSDLFNNLMELPNAVNDLPEGASATIWLSPPTGSSYFTSSCSNLSRHVDQEHRTRRGRVAPPTFASFVAKTVQSARKHLASPRQNTFGSP